MRTNLLRCRTVWLLALCVLATPSLPAATSGPARPNLVFILADDLGWGDVGWHGSKIQTPQLDALARSGVKLERHYAAPVCSPTRTGLLTGRFWSRFGVTNPQNERALPFATLTLPRALQGAGYETALIGKWHLGSRTEWGPNRFGFDHGYGSLAGGVEPWEHRYKSGPFSQTWHRNGELIAEPGHVTDLIATEAVNWLERRTSRPFFLYVAFSAPHIPIREPEQYLKLYPDVRDEAMRHYAACVTHMDAAVGRLVSALDRKRLRERTLIVFSSDNGASLGARNDDRQYPHGADYPAGPAHGSSQPWRAGKGTLYEGGIRVPAFAHWPGQLRPGEVRAPVHIVDWMPTLCALAGVRFQQPTLHDGQNVWPLISGTAKPEPRTLYWLGTGSRSQALLHGDWKLVITRGTPERVELFNLATDPYEQDNVAEREPERLAALRERLQEVAAGDNTARATDDR